MSGRDANDTDVKEAEAVEAPETTSEETTAPARPAFRRFAPRARPESDAEPAVILPEVDWTPPEPTPPIPASEPDLPAAAAQTAEAAPAAPAAREPEPEPDAVSSTPEPIAVPPPPKPSWGLDAVSPAAAAAATPPPSLSTPAPAVAPPSPPPLSDADRVAAALRKLETFDAFLVPARDPQDLLDETVGCAEWFDRRPVKRAAPARTEAPAATLEPSPALERAPLGSRAQAARAEFGGGDIGAGGDRLAAILGYLLLMVGAPTLGLGLIVALLLSRRFVRAGADDWKLSHYRFQYRTAWLGLAAGFVAGLLLFVDYVGVVAAPFLMLLVGWLTLRAAVGLHHLFQGRAHPNYMTWLV